MIQGPGVIPSKDDHDLYVAAIDARGSYALQRSRRPGRTETASPDANSTRRPTETRSDQRQSPRSTDQGAPRRLRHTPIAPEDDPPVRLRDAH
jgi:hypothetical protein